MAYALSAVLLCTPLLVVAVSAGNVKDQNPLKFPVETTSQHGDKSLISSSDNTGRLLLNPVMLLLLPFLLTGFLVVGTLFTIQLISAFAVGGLGAGLGREFNTVKINRVADLAKEFVTSEACVERFACEIANFAKYSGSVPQIRRSVDSDTKNGTWARNITRGFEQHGCSHFKCNPLKFITK